MEALSRSHPYNALSLLNCAFLPIPMSYQCEYVYVKDVVARLSVSGGNDRAMHRPPVNDIAVMSSLVLTLRYSRLRYDRYTPVAGTTIICFQIWRVRALPSVRCIRSSGYDTRLI
jgi:hypothetical protein